MNKKGWIVLAVIVVLIIAGYFLFFNKNGPLLAPTDVRVRIGNANPSITSLTAPLPITLTAGTTKDVAFQFTVRDPNGASDLIDATALATFSMSGETDRTGGCVVNSQDSKTKTYGCTVPMQYYDSYGIWNLNIYIEDAAAASASDTDTFEVYLLKAISLPVEVDLGTVATGAIDVLSSPITITNEGNFETSVDGDVIINAKNLVGVINPAENIPATNFRAGDSSGLVCTAGNFLIDSTNINTDVALPRGPTGSNTGSLSVCITSVPEISAQEYGATGGNAWLIEI